MLTVSYHLTSFSSCPVLPCLVFSCLVISCFVLPCLALPCLVLSCLVLSCRVLSSLLSCLLSWFLSTFVAVSWTGGLYRRMPSRKRHQPPPQLGSHSPPMISSQQGTPMLIPAPQRQNQYAAHGQPLYYPSAVGGKPNPNPNPFF